MTEQPALYWSPISSGMSPTCSAKNKAWAWRNEPIAAKIGSGAIGPMPAAATGLAATAVAAAAAMVPRIFRRVTDVFVGGVLSTRSAWVIGFRFLVARVRA